MCSNCYKNPPGHICRDDRGTYSSSRSSSLHLVSIAVARRIESSCSEIFVGGACLGGCDDLLAIEEQGSLQQASALSLHK